MEETNQSFHYTLGSMDSSLEHGAWDVSHTVNVLQEDVMDAKKIIAENGYTVIDVTSRWNGVEIEFTQE